MTRMPDIHGKIAEIAVDRPEVAAQFAQQVHEAISRGDGNKLFDLSCKVAWQWERAYDPYKDGGDGGDGDNDWLSDLCWD